MYESPTIAEVGSVREVTLGKLQAWRWDDSTWSGQPSYLIASF